MRDPIAVYAYRDEDGRLLYQKLRFPGKQFLQRQPDGKGSWINNLKGIEQVPYRLPELVNATLTDRNLFVVLTEGEKDCDNVRELHFAAVSSFKDWRPAFNEYIKGRVVYLLADKDESGLRMANEAAAIIEEAAACVKVVDLFPEIEIAVSGGFDVTDWIRNIRKHGGNSQHGPAGDLMSAMQNSPDWTPPKAVPPKKEIASLIDAPFFKRKTGTQWLDDALERPPSRMLFGEFWHEGELCILFADTNTGKSILGVQICQSIASGEAIGDFRLETGPQKVVYFDFELSERQFLTRYALTDDGKFHDRFAFHKNLERVEIDPQGVIPEGIPFEEFLYLRFQQEVMESGAKVIVVDNITFLRAETERAKDALPLMKQMKRLKEACGLAILVMAHTPKRSLSKPLDRNDLQGSKMIINFCDSAFAIGESSQGLTTRYLKQIKERNTVKVFHENNVPVAEIVKPDNFLRFEFKGFERERDHLRQLETDESQGELFDQAKELRSQGKSYPEIGKALGVHYKKIERLLKDHE
jgi:archaellum biogenesis ATPase FlaH